VSDERPEVLGAPEPAKGTHWGFHVGRVAAWTIVGVVSLVVLVLGVVAWYTTTPDFQMRVGREVVHVLEDATGGRVELKKITFSLRHLAVEADGLVIHGLEGPGEAPYLSAYGWWCGFAYRVESSACGRAACAFDHR